MESDLIRLADAQKVLAVSESHLLRIIEAGGITVIDVSLTGRRCPRLRRSDVERFIKEREIK